MIALEGFLGEGEVGLGFGELCFEFAGVDAGDGLAFFHRGSFLEEDLGEGAGEFCAEFGAFVGGDGAGEVDGVAEGHFLDGHDFHGLGLHGGWPGFFGCAGFARFAAA